MYLSSKYIYKEGKQIVNLGSLNTILVVNLHLFYYLLNHLLIDHCQRNMITCSQREEQMTQRKKIINWTCKEWEALYNKKEKCSLCISIIYELITSNLQIRHSCSCEIANIVHDVNFHIEVNCYMLSLSRKHSSWP